MTHEEYINKTRQATNFLMQIFGEDVFCTASIVTAQADHNKERLIELLWLVHGRCEDWIEELKAMEE